MKPEKVIMRRGDPTTNSTTDSRNESNNGLDHRIARMAYELYERRGWMDGYALYLGIVVHEVFGMRQIDMPSVR